MTKPEQGPECSKCGHVHAGIELAYICIGCPCEEQPGKPATKPEQGPEPASPLPCLLTFRGRYERRIAYMDTKSSKRQWCADLYKGDMAAAFGTIDKLVEERDAAQARIAELEQRIETNAERERQLVYHDKCYNKALRRVTELEQRLAAAREAVEDESCKQR